MPRVFNPGHRPSQPLYPDELVYTTVSKIEQFLQLPLPERTPLAGDTSVSGSNILMPVAGADYRRWGYASGDSILVYDDNDAVGSTLTLTGVSSSGSSGVVNLIAANPGTAYQSASNRNGYIQPQSALSNSKERGITKSHVEHLIKVKQDYIDTLTRMAWRPRIKVDEYQNFTTFKPYRRRYYTDYVGAVYLNNRAVQRVLRLSVWQGDYYRELAAARIKFTITEPHRFAGTEKIFLCPNVAHVATLQTGSTSTTWSKDFGPKTIAQEISNLINTDLEAGKAVIQIGSLTESGSNLNVNNEFLASANSDDGDGVVCLSSMRSTDEGEDTTIAFTNSHCFATSHGTDVQATISSVNGSTFVLDDASGFVQGHGLYFIEGNGDAVHVARCSRSDNTITVQADLTSSFANALSVSGTVKQHKFSSDATEEQRQKDWWSMEDNGAILFNNQYPFFENHSLKISYVYGERYLDKAIEDACTKLVAMDIMLTDDYTALFPEGTSNIDISAKVQRMESEIKQLLTPYQETIIVAGMGG